MRMSRTIKWKYKLHNSINSIYCVYCGDIGNTKDHVPPISYAEFYPKAEKIVVRACSLCNSTLSNLPFNTIRTRAEYLFKKYTIRFQKSLEMPFWAQWEIEELTGRLRSTVIRGLRKKQMAERKLSNLQTLVENITNNTEYLSFKDERNEEEFENQSIYRF